MLSYGSSQKLKALMVAVGDGERDLEAARQRLCSIRDFALHSAFERLDRDCSNSVSSREIVNFLRDNAVFHVSDSEAHALVKFFDSDGNQRLTFQEFIQVFLPCEDNVLRNITIDRPSIRVGRFEQLPRDIELAMSTVITKEVELARRLATLKRDLECSYDYTALTAYNTIDKFRTSSLNTVNLGGFLRDMGHFASETELIAIIRRLDTNGDASITYSEWCEFLNASPGISLSSTAPATTVVSRPLPDPLPLPSSLYYPYWRYWDYPYYGRYWPYYSRYYPSYRYPYYPYYSRYYPAPLPSETTTTTYEHEPATAYSPSRTVKRTTVHSPYGSRTYTSVL